MTSESVITKVAPEGNGSSLSEELRHRAVTAVRQEGIVQINSVLPRGFVGDLAQAYDTRQGGMTPRQMRRTSLCVGHRRYQITVDLSGPFGDSRIYANPFLLPIIHDLLGRDAVLVSEHVVCAFARSKPQKIHTDHPLLFPGFPLSRMLPSYALSVTIPLVDLDMSVGTTAMWLKSHIEAATPAERDFATAAYPVPRMGDACVMDYRLAHAGIANRSRRTRPILYLLYARPWFTDAVNFKKQPKLMIDDLSAVAVEHLSLFSHIRAAMRVAQLHQNWHQTLEGRV